MSGVYMALNKPSTKRNSYIVCDVKCVCKVTLDHNVKTRSSVEMFKENVYIYKQLLSLLNI